MSRRIEKLLIANRGEIAVRVIRTCRELGIRSVAAYSDADQESIHAKLGDEAIRIGPAESSKSYLNPDAILEAAHAAGVQAVHPGYGFLSERASFAEACAEAGLIFVGPSGSAMRALGDKISAKTLAVSAGVPIVPGFFDPGASFDQICDAAARIGYPVMLKASAGGGGRGMREVASADRLESEFVTASAEARSVFGDGAMMVEKLIARPRHVEVQVLADHHGNVATLFERECSIQRRHQKLIEEAPSPFEILRWKAMRAAAANVVRAAGYSNAGTVEFIVDPVSGEFYFLEVNARLQVEHPVTEAITGLDLVAWQIRIAEGEPLDLPEALLNGERPGICGHAIEVRIIAEDPSRQFVPSIGKILAWAEPMSSVVRVDTGFGPGSEITPYYDSLLAKLIVHGQNRAEALRRMEAALMDFHILGVRTNVEYLLAVIRHPEFAAGKIDTGFLGREFHEWMPGAPAPEVGSIASRAGNTARRSGEASRGPLPASSLADGFRNVGS